MNRQQQGSRILWLVRSLTITGLLVVVITLLQVGWNLAEVRTQRAQASAAKEQLDKASSELRRLTALSETEIGATFDETASHYDSRGATAHLAGLIRAQLDSHPDPIVLQSLNRLSTLAAKLVDLANSANSWRAQYNVVWSDVSTERSQNIVRAMIGQMRNAVDALDGQRRLAAALKYRQWRQATGDDANAQAAAILHDQARRQAAQSADVKDQLAEIARLVEVLGGAQVFDSLADLKDNQLKPALDHLSRSVDAESANAAAQQLSTALTPQSVRALETAIFGQGYVVDEAHQNIQVGRGGLFALNRDELQLRRQRDALHRQTDAAIASIEGINGEFAQAAQTRTVSLTQEIERGLANGLQRMWIVGACCSVLFLWLATLISRGIKAQVNVIEQARAEAEKGRHLTQQLMLKEQAAAAELTAAHAGLQTSERRFRTLSASAPIGIFEYDTAGRLAYANPQWEKITDMPLSASLGDGWQKAIHPDDAAQVIQEWNQAAAACLEFKREFRFRTAAGDTRWVSARTTTIRSENDQVLGHVGTLADITERKAAEAELEIAHEKLLDTTRRAGMAEIATSVIHNVGNVLNSVNVSVSVASSKLQNSPVNDLTRAVQMITDHKADLAAFLTQDQRGQQIPAFLEAAADVLATEQRALLEELASLSKNVDHIKQIVQVQQTHARVSGMAERIELVELMDDALHVNMVAVDGSPIAVVREFATSGSTTTDKHAILQILINLVSNAKHAVMGVSRADKTITVRTELLMRDNRQWIRLQLSDNGEGIDPANLTRIFSHGFTTKRGGHGFGLHSSANTAKQLGGSLTAHSDGPGTGATFVLELPVVETQEQIPANTEVLAA